MEIVKVELIIIISRRESKVHFALHARFLIGNCKLIVLKVANERRLASSFEFFIKLFIIFMKYQSFANKIDYQYNQLTLKFTNFFFFFQVSRSVRSGRPREKKCKRPISQ